MNEQVTRRRLLNLISIGLTALAGAVMSIPILAYLLSPLLNPAQQVWLAIGPVTRFRIGETSEAAFEDPSPLPWAGQTARTALWLRRTGESSFIAFAVNCSHLGCPVSWQARAELFVCPCHGGVYYADGSVASGPPPHALARYETRVRNGQVEILTRPLPMAEGA
jgi:menaquinol-cytochrome c reductase iron-sulfur subunit